MDQTVVDEVRSNPISYLATGKKNVIPINCIKTGQNELWSIKKLIKIPNYSAFFKDFCKFKHSFGNFEGYLPAYFQMIAAYIFSKRSSKFL